MDKETSTEVVQVTILCPDCNSEIEIPEEPQVDNIIICDECGAEIKISSFKMEYELVEEEK
jgi:lysine biosynthesis protein LysW